MKHVLKHWEGTYWSDVAVCSSQPEAMSDEIDGEQVYWGIDNNGPIGVSECGATYRIFKKYEYQVYLYNFTSRQWLRDGKPYAELSQAFRNFSDQVVWATPDSDATIIHGVSKSGNFYRIVEE